MDGTIIGPGRTSALRPPMTLPVQSDGFGTASPSAQLEQECRIVESFRAAGRDNGGDLHGGRD